MYLPAFAGGNLVVLTSLDWPPYTGENLPGGGASAEVVRAAFKAVGYDLEIRFYPWKRTLDEARNTPEVMGYFPEYHDENRARFFSFSDSIGKSPLGLAKRRARTFDWDGVRDLRKYQIGIVQGYVNTKEFDRLVATGDLRVEASISDVLNLRKVLAGRMDMAVVDTNVYTYLTQTDDMLHARRGELSISSKLLTIHDIFVCFRKGKEGDKLLSLFNEGLSRIRPMLIQREYVESIGRVK